MQYTIDDSEILEVKKIEPETGALFTFRARTYEPNIDSLEMTDLPPLDFLLRAFRIMYAKGKHESMFEDLGKQAAESLPILANLLSEVVVTNDAGGGNDFRVSTKYAYYFWTDTYSATLDGSTDLSSLTESQNQQVSDFFDSLVRECFNTTASALAMTMYDEVHRGERTTGVKKVKTRNRKKAEPKDKNPFKVSGHFVDQKLKYYQPGAVALDLFDSLKKETKEKIVELNIERTTVVEGIRLAPSEQKVIDALCKLLHQKSHTKDPNDQAYYTGNKGVMTVAYGGKNEDAPQLAFTLYELTKEFKGEDLPSGKDLSNVSSILHEIEAKRFLLSYTETTHKPGGKRTERKIEEFQALVKIMKYSEVDYNSSDEITRQQQEIIVSLNPIFKHQIDSKFILYPYDINRRTIIAYGSHNIADASLRLRDWLMRAKSYGHLQAEIDTEKLYWLLCDKWMKEKRKKKVGEYVDRAILTATRLELLLGHETITGAAGQSKVVFNINKDFA
jgi:hypothetical protein